MVDANSAESPVETVATTVGERTTEAFELLGNETIRSSLVASKTELTRLNLSA